MPMTTPVKCVVCFVVGISLALLAEFSHSAKPGQQPELLPSQIILLRHGESTANKARAEVEATDAETVDPGGRGISRDFDAKLTVDGGRQARAAGLWLAKHMPQSLVVVSPLARTLETWANAAEACGSVCKGIEPEWNYLVREKEWGIQEGLTRPGFKHRYPDEAAREERQGPVLYRSLGGESMLDVAHRVQTFLSEMARMHPGKPLVVVCHAQTIIAFRAILERWEEKRWRAEMGTRVPNGSITVYTRSTDGKRFVLEQAYLQPPPEEE